LGAEKTNIIPFKAFTCFGCCKAFKATDDTKIPAIGQAEQWIFGLVKRSG